MNWFIRAAGLALCFLTIACSTLPPEVSAGFRSYQQHDYDGAISHYTTAINAGNLSPDNLATTYFLRGGSYRFKGDYTNAISDFTNAIRIKPDGVSFYLVRGLTYFSVGETSAGLADYDAALRLKPELGQSYENRGLAYALAGQFDKAAADYDTAIRIKSRAEGYLGRGVSYLFLANFAAATRDFEEASKTGSGTTRAYGVVFLHLARAKDGQDDAAVLAENARRIDTKTWPGPAMMLFQGQILPEQALAAASSTAPDERNRRNQICEASFFIGEYALLHNDAAEAKHRLREAAETCPKEIVPHSASVSELRRIGG